MFIKRHHQPSKISFLSLLLKIASEGASLTSELNWFQSLGPRNEIDFCPFDVLKRGTSKSALVFLSLIVVRAEFCTNSSDRYSGARPLFDLYIMVAVSHRIMSEITDLLKPVTMGWHGVTNTTPDEQDASFALSGSLLQFFIVASSL